MPDGTIRLGILGAGAMGAVHATAYAGIEGVEVAAVFARDAQHAGSVAALCKARPCTDADALIADPAVDAIDVCVPSAIHDRFVIAALEQGKHVFCESPLALDLTHARRMLEAARRADRLLQVGLLMRSVSAYEHVKAVTDSGERGRLLSLSTWRLGSYLRPGAPDHKAHYSDPSTELMTFDFDVANWLMGLPAHLSASATRTPQGDPGEITALLGYDDGRQATIVASGLMPRQFRFSVGFRAVFEAAAFELRTVFEGDPPRSTFTVVSDEAPSRPVVVPDRNPYQVELQRFVDCIRGRGDPQHLDAGRAVDALVLSVAAQRALRGSGGAVQVSGIG